MKLLKLTFATALFFSTCVPAFADMSYDDYVEAFNAADKSTTFYIYKSTIAKNNGIVSFDALEVKSQLEVPNSKKGEPYLALKYKFKYNCAKRLYTEAVTAVMQIESGWGEFDPKRIQKDASTWLPVPNNQQFNAGMFKAFCK